jgi:hypothetical protein
VRPDRARLEARHEAGLLVGQQVRVRVAHRVAQQQEVAAQHLARARVRARARAGRMLRRGRRRDRQPRAQRRGRGRVARGLCRAAHLRRALDGVHALPALTDSITAAPDQQEQQAK